MADKELKEPVLKITASDPVANEVVRYYAQVYERVAQVKRRNTGGINDAERAHVSAIRELLEQFREYRRAKGLDG